MVKLLQTKEHTLVIRGKSVTWMEEENGGDEERLSDFAGSVSTHCGCVECHI